MRPLAHVVASGVISTFVGIYFKSFGCAAISFISGVFIDLDHLFDYYANHRFTFKIKRIYCACLRIRFKKLYLLLHAYELVIAFWVLIFVLRLSNPWKAAAIGITQHMIFDQLCNPMSRFGYFLSYRVAKGFRIGSILHKDYAAALARKGTTCHR